MGDIGYNGFSKNALYIKEGKPLQTDAGLRLLVEEAGRLWNIC
jgi:hypothetical protein